MTIPEIIWVFDVPSMGWSEKFQRGTPDSQPYIAISTYEKVTAENERLKNLLSLIAATARGAP